MNYNVHHDALYQLYILNQKWINKKKQLDDAKDKIFAIKSLLQNARAELTIAKRCRKTSIELTNIKKTFKIKIANVAEKTNLTEKSFEVVKGRGAINYSCGRIHKFANVYDVALILSHWANLTHFDAIKLVENLLVEFQIKKNNCDPILRRVLGLLENESLCVCNHKPPPSHITSRCIVCDTTSSCLWHKLLLDEHSFKIEFNNIQKQLQNLDCAASIMLMCPADLHVNSTDRAQFGMVDDFTKGRTPCIKTIWDVGGQIMYPSVKKNNNPRICICSTMSESHFQYGPKCLL